jgi:hypothetical protein
LFLRLHAELLERPICIIARSTNNSCDTFTSAVNI